MNTTSRWRLPALLVGGLIARRSDFAGPGRRQLARNSGCNRIQARIEPQAFPALG